jgi:hypothetical protein
MASAAAKARRFHGFSSSKGKALSWLQQHALLLSLLKPLLRLY